MLGANGRVEAVRIERNELIVDHNGGLRSKGTGQFEVIEAGLLTLKGIRDDLRDPAKVEALLRRRGIDYAC